MTHHRGPGDSPFSFLPRAQNPRFSSPDSSSIFPLLKSRMSRCEQNVMCWSFKRVPVPLLTFLWWIEKPCYFSQPDIMWAPLSGSGGLAQGTQLEVKTHVSEGEPPLS